MYVVNFIAYICYFIVILYLSWRIKFNTTRICKHFSRYCLVILENEARLDLHITSLLNKCGFFAETLSWSVIDWSCAYVGKLKSKSFLFDFCPSNGFKDSKFCLLLFSRRFVNMYVGRVLIFKFMFKVYQLLNQSQALRVGINHFKSSYQHCFFLDRKQNRGCVHSSNQ